MMYFLCCKSVFLSIIFMALCKALHHLCGRKLEIPSYAKPIMLDAMPPNTEANIAPLLGLLFIGRVGNIKPISFV